MSALHGEDCRQSPVCPHMILLYCQDEDYYPNWYKTGLAGWGLTLNEGNISNTLMKVSVSRGLTELSCDSLCEGERAHRVGQDVPGARVPRQPRPAQHPELHHRGQPHLRRGHVRHGALQGEYRDLASVDTTQRPYKCGQ